MALIMAYNNHHEIKKSKPDCISACRLWKRDSTVLISSDSHDKSSYFLSKVQVNSLLQRIHPLSNFWTGCILFLGPIASESNLENYQRKATLALFKLGPNVPKQVLPGRIISKSDLVPYVGQLTLASNWVINRSIIQACHQTHDWMMRKNQGGAIIY